MKCLRALILLPPASFQEILSPIESSFQNSILRGALYGLILFTEFKLLLILLNSETKEAT